MKSCGPFKHTWKFIGGSPLFPCNHVCTKCGMKGDHNPGKECPK